MNRNDALGSTNVEKEKTKYKRNTKPLIKRRHYTGSLEKGLMILEEVDRGIG